MNAHTSHHTGNHAGEHAGHHAGQHAGQHANQVVERRCDVCVVGGSAAGLATALQLVRQRRSVIVVDSGGPRNAPAAHMHGYLGLDGASPRDLVDAGCDDVRRYGGEVLTGRVVDVHQRDEGSFEVELTGRHTIVARRVIAATGLVDELPDIEGVAAHWGGDVIHCPFCHGYEARDRHITVILTHPAALHPVTLFRHLTDDLVVVVHDPDGFEGDGPDGNANAAGALERLRADGVDVREGPVTRLVDGADGHLTAVELTDGTLVPSDVVVVGPRFRARTEGFASLGLEPSAHASGLGDVLAAAANGGTAVPGVFAVGNVADPGLQVLHAAANGSRVGAMVAFDLAADDQQRPPIRPAAETDWDGRYSGEQLWSGAPNGSLVAEVASLAPGRALDVGAGEGGDAVWLAEQGWTVTASDISAQALARVAAAAAQRGVEVAHLHTDANALGAFPDRSFDLVAASYASIPRTPDHRAVHSIPDAVAPGGTLVVVSHDLAAMRGPVDVVTGSRAYDADAFERVQDFVEVIESSPDWHIEVDETRPRPAGAASTHHVDDIVLRARRHR